MSPKTPRFGICFGCPDGYPRDDDDDDSPWRESRRASSCILSYYVQPPYRLRYRSSEQPVQKQNKRNGLYSKMYKTTALLQELHALYSIIGLTLDNALISCDVKGYLLILKRNDVEETKERWCKSAKSRVDCHSWFGMCAARVENKEHIWSTSEVGAPICGFSRFHRYCSSGTVDDRISDHVGGENDPWADVRPHPAIWY